MRNILLILFLAFFSRNAIAQENDSLAPYRQFTNIPQFKILLMDSTTWFTKAGLSSKKPTWIIYFSPDCGHCQIETEEIISNINSLRNIQILLVTSRPFEDVKAFYDHYLLKRFSNIIVGIDPARMFVNFYQVQTTPFSALYSKKGRLLKEYRSGASIPELISLAR